MSRRGRHIAEGPAHLPQAISVQPAFSDAAPDSPAVGPQLTPPDAVVAALVIEDEKTNRVRHPIEQPRIDDKDAWRRSTLAGQSPVEHAPCPAAAEGATSHRKTSIPLNLETPARSRRSLSGRKEAEKGCERAGKAEQLYWILHRTLPRDVIATQR